MAFCAVGGVSTQFFQILPILPNRNCAKKERYQCVAGTQGPVTASKSALAFGGLPQLVEYTAERRSWGVGGASTTKEPNERRETICLVQRDSRGLWEEDERRRVEDAGDSELTHSTVGWEG